MIHNCRVLCLLIPLFLLSIKFENTAGQKHIIINNTISNNSTESSFVKSQLKGEDGKPLVEDDYDEEDIKSRKLPTGGDLPDSNLKSSVVKTKIKNGAEKVPEKEDYDEDNITSRRFHIGGVLPDLESESFFQRMITYLNFDGISVSPTCTLYNVTIISSGNPIRDARLVCENIITKGVFAMIIGGGNMSSAATSAVSYTGGFYHIPVIGTSARESAFSDKNIHVSFLRTVPPYSHQADVWVKLLKELKYRQVVFIHSSDSDGRALLGKLRSIEETTQDDKTVKIYSVIEFEPGLISYANILWNLKESLVKVFLLFASKKDSEVIMNEAHNLKLTGKGTVWLLSEDAMKAKDLPIGALGLQLKHGNNQEGHISDSLRLVTLALRKLHDNSPDLIVQPPNTCEREEPWNVTGKLLFRALQEQVLFNGKTGKVAFDSKGDRRYAEYFILNIQNVQHEGRKDVVSVGELYHDENDDQMKLRMNESKIVWCGGERKKPSGISVPRDLKVLTIEETPFLYSESLIENEGYCNDTDESICYKTTSNSSKKEERCCYGYCVELLKKLAETNDFLFTLHISTEKGFGERHVGKKGASVWSGMIGELVNTTNGADMIVAPLTINPERAQVIDFSKPFKYQGITILVKKSQRTPDLVSILQPFQFNLWMMLLATVHAIALLVWLLDRLSPMFKREGKESDSLRISEAFWFSWGVILNSGLGEGTPRCLSSRVMSMIWAGFAMIIVASYTANLAAFLVLKDHGESISGINDPKLRNPVEDFRFGTVRGSSVDMFFRRKTEWANMYRVMEANNFDSAEEAIEAVKNGSLKAFIWDSSRLEFEASRNCDLVTVGELFGRSGYGIGIRKGLFWSEKITLDILEFHESGFMADLDDKWIWAISEDCPPDKLHSPQRLGLANLEGIFMMIVGGVILGIILIIIELLYQKYKSRFRKSVQKSRKINDWRDNENAFEKEFADEDGVIKGNLISQRCQFCESNEKINEKNHCSFCSEALLMTGCENDKDTNSFWGELNNRIELSKNIPKNLKSSNPKQWISNQMKINHFKDQEHFANSCPQSLNENDLKNMASFVEENHLNSIPGCCCHSNALYLHSTADEESSSLSASSFESKDIETESIISGEFSCPLLKEVSGRSLQNETCDRFTESKLPDVIYTKKTSSDYSEESDDHKSTGRKVYYI